MAIKDEIGKVSTLDPINLIKSLRFMVSFMVSLSYTNFILSILYVNTMQVITSK